MGVGPSQEGVSRRPEAVEQSSLVVRLRDGSGGKAYWDAQWRYRLGPREPWRFKRKRLGLAWMERDPVGAWRKRKGRCADGWLDERAANVAADAAVRAYATDVTEAAARARAELERGVTVRELAHEWLRWLGQVKGAKPATLRDYSALLREPGRKFARGDGESPGRIMAGLGGLTAARVSTTDVSRFLRALDDEGLSARNVNKHRQVLAAMFTFGCREDTFGLERNPVLATDKRRETPPAALDYYEVEDVEALARACERGEQRLGAAAVDAAEREARAREDRQDADAFRLLFYTGIRLGEALVLRWGDVDLEARLALVRRALSAGVETLPKGRNHRFVPLSMPAVEALARLGSREDFIDADDYVLCNRFGRRLDGSALRRRYSRACAAAGLRRVKLHGLRHAAGSLVARTTDAVFVRDFLGHAKLSTTDRYVSAKYRPDEFARLDRAFAKSDLESSELAPTRSE